MRLVVAQRAFAWTLDLGVEREAAGDNLGPSFPLPVEVVPFCAEHTRRLLAALPSVQPALDRAVLRMGPAHAGYALRGANSIGFGCCGVFVLSKDV